MSSGRHYPLLFIFTMLVMICLTSTVLSIPSEDLVDQSNHSRAKRLTTFGGKSPSNPSPPPIVGRGKECKSDKDCEIIQYTSCKLDHRDERRRCICGDGSPPANGQCQNRPRGLRESCHVDAECLEGAECKINPNATTAVEKRQPVCLCREGRMEMSNMCSGSEKNTEGVSIILVGLAALISLATRNLK